MLTFRRGILATLFACSALVFAAPASAVPISTVQTITADPVQGFGTFTDFHFTLGGWSVPFASFTDVNQITQIKITFDSLDPDYIDNGGPTGGTTWAAVYVRTDSNALSALASVDHASPNINLAAAQGAFFTTVRNLIADGQVTFTVGAYEAFPTFVRPFTLHGLSSLRVEVDGNVPAIVPEPSTMVLFGTGLLAMLCLTRRSGSILSHLVMTTGDQGDTWIAGTSSGWGWLGFRSSGR